MYTRDVSTESTIEAAWHQICHSSRILKSLPTYGFTFSVPPKQIAVLAQRLSSFSTESSGFDNPGCTESRLSHFDASVASMNENRSRLTGPTKVDEKWHSKESHLLSD